SSTSSCACAPGTGGPPARASASRSARASWRRTAAGWRRPAAARAAAARSASIFRSRCSSRTLEGSLPNPAKVLVVDDEPQIRRFLRASLGAHGHTTLEAETAAEAIRLCTTQSPDIVILDLGLPDQDGLAIIKEIREWSKVPIIVLSVRADERDKVDALDLGADDYVTKPFGMGELLARMRAVQRARKGGGEEESPIFQTGGLMVDLAKRAVTVDGHAVKLTKKEYNLLRLLVQHAGK